MKGVKWSHGFDTGYSIRKGSYLKVSLKVWGTRSWFKRPIIYCPNEMSAIRIPSIGRNGWLIPFVETPLLQFSVMEQTWIPASVLEYSLMIWTFLCISGCQIHSQFFQTKMYAIDVAAKKFSQFSFCMSTIVICHFLAAIKALDSNIDKLKYPINYLQSLELLNHQVEFIWVT